MIQGLKVDTRQTSEKFRHQAKEVLDFLISNLQRLDELEKEMYARYQILQAQMLPGEIDADDFELWMEYSRRSEAIIAPIIYEPGEIGFRSIGKPSKYDYLYHPDTNVYFIMKSAERAVVETHFELGIAQKNQFVLKRSGTNWKIYSKKYNLQGNKTWHVDEV